MAERFDRIYFSHFSTTKRSNSNVSPSGHSCSTTATRERQKDKSVIAHVLLFNKKYCQDAQRNAPSSQRGNLYDAIFLTTSGQTLYESIRHDIKIILRFIFTFIIHHHLGCTLFVLLSFPATFLGLQYRRE